MDTERSRFCEGKVNERLMDRKFVRLSAMRSRKYAEKVVSLIQTVSRDDALRTDRSETCISAKLQPNDGERIYVRTCAWTAYPIAP